MIGDLKGEGFMINITVEVQHKPQDGYAVRGTLTSGNAMRAQFNMGDDYTEAPDVIGVNILGFCLPELKNRKMFCSRIVRAEYDSGETFLADKYSDYYVELPKLKGFTKDELPESHHDLWDLCRIFETKVKDQKEVINVENITNPVAVELSEEIIRAVAPAELVNEALARRKELEDLHNYVIREREKAAQKAAQEAERKAQEAAQEAERKAQETKEDMLVMAIQSGAPNDTIEAMRKKAGVTDARLAELRELAKTA